MNHLLKKKWLFVITFLLGSLDLFSQDRNIHGLLIVSDLHVLKDQIQQDSNKQLVEIKKFIPSIKLDIKYATTQNIFYTRFYNQAKAYVRLPVAKALVKVEKELNEMGLGLKIFDAYRPYTITCMMFNLLPDTLYMGLPWYGSKHNRGIALDLTLIDRVTKKELKMPTPYDALVYPAHPEFMKLSNEVIANRELLKATMKKHGFKVDPMEWWHFNFVSATNFELLDISFENLQFE
ncbi:MAG: M15 family metallopeptidase [Sediminibacterium sp.]